MKRITYIVKPSDNKEVLIRCIYSLYRQEADNFHVIVAENDFGIYKNEIDELLDLHETLSVISDLFFCDEDKLKAAFSMNIKCSDYVVVVGADTVVSPLASSVIGKYNSDCILLAYAEEGKQGFCVNKFESVNIYEILSDWNPMCLAWSTSYLSFVQDLYLSDNESYKLEMSAIGNMFKVDSCEKICFYFEHPSIKKELEKGVMSFETSKYDVIDYVPALFKEGRLGLSVLIRCLRGWFYYKLHRG